MSIAIRFGSLIALRDISVTSTYFKPLIFAKLFKLLLKVFISFDISFLSKPSPNGDDPQSGMEIIKTLPFFFFKLFILINSLSKSFLNSLTGLELN